MCVCGGGQAGRALGSAVVGAQGLGPSALPGLSHEVLTLSHEVLRVSLKALAAGPALLLDPGLPFRLPSTLAIAVLWWNLSAMAGTKGRFSCVTLAVGVGLRTAAAGSRRFGRILTSFSSFRFTLAIPI